MFVFLKETSKLWVCVCVSLLSWPIYFAKGRRLRPSSRSSIWFWLLLELNSRNRTEAAGAPPAPRKAPAATTSVTGAKKLDDGAINPWDLAQIWVESVAKEEATRKQWEQTHAWMADFDPRVCRTPSKGSIWNVPLLLGKHQTEEASSGKFYPFLYCGEFFIRNRFSCLSTVWLLMNLGPELSWSWLWLAIAERFRTRNPKSSNTLRRSTQETFSNGRSRLWLRQKELHCTCSLTTTCFPFSLINSWSRWISVDALVFRFDDIAWFNHSSILRTLTTPVTHRLQPAMKFIAARLLQLTEEKKFQLMFIGTNRGFLCYSSPSLSRSLFAVCLLNVNESHSEKRSVKIRIE